MAVSVSVVVPTYKRPHLLERCLAALAAQDVDSGTFEVIVADDGTDDATRRAVDRWQGQGGLRLAYVPVHDNHGPAAARNRGWRKARGSIIAFTDDDCVPAPDWLRAGLAAFDEDIAAVWGRIEMPLPLDPTDYELDASRLQQAEFATANCFCRRDMLATVGGLDEHFTAAWREDSDLYFNLLEHGAWIRRAPAAVVRHPIRPAPWGVSLRQQRKVLFDALLYKKHPRLYRSRIRSRPPWHYYGVSGMLVLGLLALAAGSMTLALAAGAAWSWLTGRFCWSRLQHTSRRLSHIVEMAVTSAFIPPLAVFWRLAGALKFRVVFL